MLGLFKKKETTYGKTIIATSRQVLDAETKEEEFLKDALTCPECGYLNNEPWVRSVGRWSFA